MCPLILPHQYACGFQNGIIESIPHFKLFVILKIFLIWICFLTFIFIAENRLICYTNAVKDMVCGYDARVGSKHLFLGGYISEISYTF